jgi:ABC-type glycerol-3-phosphate transport system substrate-binding protein
MTSKHRAVVLPAGRTARRSAALAAAIVMVIGVAGCGSSKSSSGGSSTSGAASTPGGGAPTGGAPRTIKIFVSGDASSSQPGVPVLPFARAAALSVKGFNSRHTNIKVVETFCDTKSNPNATLACARKATTGGYSAVILSLGFFDYILTKVTAAAGIPTIAATVQDPQTWNNKSVFCLTNTLIGSISGLGPIAKSVGVTKLGVATFAGPSQTSTVVNTTRQAMTAAGIKLSSVVQVPLSTADWSPSITQALSGHPNALSLTPLPGPEAVAIFAAARQIAGQSVKFVEPSFEIDAQLAATPAVQGAVASGWAMPPQTPGVPGTALFRSDVAKWGDPGQDLAEPSELSWLAVQLAGNLAATIKGPITAHSMTTALSTSKNISMYGITPPFAGSQRGINGQACVSNNTVVHDVIAHGKLVAVHPGQFIDPQTGKTITAN